MFQKFGNFTKKAALVAAIASVCTVSFAQSADNFPNRPIKLMVGFPPGGSTDTPTRVLAENASKILNTPIVVENKVGAAGVMPAHTLQTAEPDGYTLGIIVPGVFRLPYTTKINWDPTKDLSYIIRLSALALGVVVPASSPIQTWEEYVEYARKNPGELTYATSGIATANHLTMERISRAEGIELLHVPYKGSADAVRAMLSNEVQSASDTSAWAPYVEEGRFRLLVVWGENRMKRFPDVPTLKELGVDIVQSAPWGIAAPKDMPQEVINKLHAAFKQAMEMPNFQKALDVYDMETAYMGPEEYRQFAIKSSEEEREILEALNMIVE